MKAALSFKIKVRKFVLITSLFQKLVGKNPEKGYSREALETNRRVMEAIDKIYREDFGLGFR